MSVLPSRLEDLLTFMDTHAEIWQANAAALGILPASATAFKTASGVARSQYVVQLNAYEAARGQAAKQRTSTAAARSQAADLIRTIKAFAETQANPATVYALAQIPAPAERQPAPPPGTPTDFTAQLENNGAITIRWKAANPSGQSGTVWTISRRVGGSGPFTFVGASGTREFTDRTVPASGASGVSYVVQGQRAEAVGNSSLPFTVQFGVTGGGLTITNAFSEAA
jgi:hypothetical protein